MTAPSSSPGASSGDDPALELRRRLQGVNVYLIGMMGSGKSAVGRPLAEALGYRFLDADTSLEQVAGRSISELFASEGEAGFRTLEAAVLNQIAAWHSLVVATGGGVVTRPENWGQLHQGIVVWLDAAGALLMERLRADPTPRPLLACVDPAARLAGLLQERRPLYAQADLAILQDGRPPEAVAQQVIEALPAILRQRPAAPTQPVALIDSDGAIANSFN